MNLEKVKEHLSSDLLYEDDRVGCINLTAPVCFLTLFKSTQVTQCVPCMILAVLCVLLVYESLSFCLSFCLFVNKHLPTILISNFSQVSVFLFFTVCL